MLRQPYDLAVIFAIISIIVVTAGFGVQSVINKQNVTTDQSFFTNVRAQINGTHGLEQTSVDVSGGLTGDVGASVETSEESILVNAFYSILTLGSTWGLVTQTVGEGIQILGIDPVYWIIITSTILIIFGVVLFSWIRRTAG